MHNITITGVNDKSYKAIIAKIKVELKDKNYPNLKPWRAGQSGNPAGRKVGSKNLSTIVRELLEQDADTDLLSKGNIADTNPSKIMLTKEQLLNLVKSAHDKTKAGSAVEKDRVARILFLNLSLDN